MRFVDDEVHLDLRQSGAAHLLGRRGLLLRFLKMRHQPRAKKGRQDTCVDEWFNLETLAHHDEMDGRHDPGQVYALV